jgi:hypothetical protein
MYRRARPSYHCGVIEALSTRQMLEDIEQRLPDVKKNGSRFGFKHWRTSLRVRICTCFFIAASLLASCQSSRVGRSRSVAVGKHPWLALLIQGESGDYPDPEDHTAKCRISLRLKSLYRGYSGIVIFFFT